MSQKKKSGRRAQGAGGMREFARPAAANGPKPSERRQPREASRSPTKPSGDRRIRASTSWTFGAVVLATAAHPSALVPLLPWTLGGAFALTLLDRGAAILMTLLDHGYLGPPRA
jgi:hypothetical protein